MTSNLKNPAKAVIWTARFRVDWTGLNCTIQLFILFKLVELVELVELIVTTQPKFNLT